MRFLLAFCLFCCSFSALAGYAQLVPPAPLTLQPGGVTTVPYAAIPAANAPRIVGGHVLANASLNLGARTVSVPVGLRVAANASRFFRFNPLTQIAQSLAAEMFQAWTGVPVNCPAHLQHLCETPPPWDYNSETQNIQIGEIVIDTEIVDVVVVANGVNTRVGDLNVCSAESFDCSIVDIQPYNGQIAVQKREKYYPWQTSYSYDWQYFIIAAGSPLPGSSSTTPPRPPDDDELEFITLYPVSPSWFPAFDLPIPVDPVPIINPLVDPLGNPLVGPEVNPAPELVPSPFRVPAGDPVPLPGTSPPQFEQPWFEVSPAATPEDPWRVDVVQVVTVETGEVIQPDPVQPPLDCDLYPNALTCADRDNPDDEPIPRETRVIELQSGASFSGGSCPGNLLIQTHGATFTVFNSAVPCGWITSAKYVIILLAALSAVSIVRPGGRKVRAVNVDD